MEKSTKIQAKGNNSFITNDIPIKLHVHNHTMVIYIQYKLYAIPFTGYLMMAEDVKMDRLKDGGSGQGLFYLISTSFLNYGPRNGVDKTTGET